MGGTFRTATAQNQAYFLGIPICKAANNRAVSTAILFILVSSLLNEFKCSRYFSDYKSLRYIKYNIKLVRFVNLAKKLGARPLV